MLIFFLLDQSNVHKHGVSWAEQEKRKVKNTHWTCEQALQNVSIKARAKGCNCLFFVGKPTFSVWPEYVC